MADRGRPRTPTAILKATGGYRADRHQDREHEPKSGTELNCPDWLAGNARDFWNDIVPKLEAMNIVDGADLGSLIGLCVAWSAWMRERVAYEDGSGHIYKVSCAWSMFDKIASKFGLAPTDRQKLATAKPDEADDAFTEWLKENQN